MEALIVAAFLALYFAIVWLIDKAVQPDPEDRQEPMTFKEVLDDLYERGRITAVERANLLNDFTPRHF